MTDAGSERSERDGAEETTEEHGDLDVPDSVDVRGGATAITIKATGEKQGGPKTP